MKLLRKGLECRYLPILLAILAFLISIPALKTGLFADDLLHRTILIDPNQLPDQFLDSDIVPENSGSLTTAMMDMFGFFRQTNMQKLMDYGVAPWWTYKGVRAAFWRPVTSFTHWLDYRVFPDNSFWMHFHSLIWFSAIIFLITILYRRFLTPLWVAGFAACLYLLDENNYVPAMFIANRNALIALFFGIIALIHHDKWRRESAFLKAALSILFLSLCLLSAEAGLAIFAYFLAYAIAIEQGSWVNRIKSLLPAILMTIIWRVAYNILGYGVCAGGVYIDPVQEPFLYFSAVLKRFPLLLMGQLSWQSPDILLFCSKSTNQIGWVVSVIFMILVFIISLPLLKANKVAKFFFLGMLFSILPFCATMATSRNLLFVGIGAMGFVTHFINEVFTRQNWIPRLRLYRIGAWILCIMFLVAHVPLAAAGRIITPKMANIFLGGLNTSMDIGPAKDLETRQVIIVNTPNPLFIGFAPFLNAYHGRPIPKAIRTLACSFEPLEINRAGPKNLLIKTKSGNLLRYSKDVDMHPGHVFTTLNDILRPRGYPIQAAEKITLPDVEITVVTVDSEGLPTEVLFEFTVELEDKSLYWLEFNWQDGLYHPFEIPEVGHSRVVSGPPIFSRRATIEFILNRITK